MDMNAASPPAENIDFVVTKNICIKSSLCGTTEKKNEVTV